ncbi:AAA family ATPase, partial [Moraxella catarrhalis]|uniref:AAA family ATPase n=1 Tax=Moraxella catarrhalis TaxID=480 RepID=UPI00128E5C2B
PAAPTRKGSQRINETLLKAQGKANDVQVPKPKPNDRLLGVGANGSPRYDAKNPPPLDMLIIAEASMLGTELASQLFAGIATGCRVILLGDTHQLGAGDAGAVLAVLCRIERLRHLRVNLTASKRFTDTSGVCQL